MFWKKKTKPQIDTSIKGFRYVGIKLTEDQFYELCGLEWQRHAHPELFVFHTMILLKILGVLPKEMLLDIDEEDMDFERKYGRRRCIY